MQRRGGNEQPVKGQRRSGNKPKARNAPTAQVSGVDLQEQLDRRTRERDEALERETATAEILGAISGSPTDTQPVFDAIVQSGLKLFPNAATTIVLPDGDQMLGVAIADKDSKREKAWRRRFPSVLNRTQMHGTAILDCKVIDFSDVKEHVTGPMAPGAVNFLASGYRAITIMPMIRGKTAIGAISVVRVAPGPLSEKQRELLKTFAAQAVIAIENTRLLNELRQRTNDLSESLEQQTATSEVLKIVSSSPGELQPVFNTMLANSTRICDAKFATLYLRDGADFHAVAATHDAPPAYIEARKRNLWQPSPGGPLERVAITKEVVHIVDLRTQQSYLDRHPFIVAAVELGGFQTALVVPMLRNNELVGAISILRQEVRPFTDKQIELVKNFAAQAVIAIENTRLLSELRESLQQQTATADVLKVISRSTFDLQTVLDTLVESAARLCEAYDSSIFLRQGESLRHRAHHGPIPQDLADLPIGRGFVNGRALVDRTPVHVHDLQAAAHEFPGGSKAALRLGHRTILAIPLLRQGEAIGVLAIRRTEVKPFTDKQIELVRTFADQAVIAIENVRLFEAEQQRTRELSESLEQQTATSEVLKIISSSPGELEPVFNAMLENATRICEATFGNLFLREGSLLRAVAVHSKETYSDYYRRSPIFDLRDHPKVPLARVVHSKQVFRISDLRTDESYIEKDDRIVALVEIAGARSLAVVPMLKDNEVIGAITIYRQEVRPFTDKQIELVQNFAAQAVIAIDNTRLLNELRQRTDDLSESLEQQTATSEVLKVISSSAGELRRVFETMLENAVRICGAKFGNLWLREGDVFRIGATHGAPQAYVDYIRREQAFRPDPRLGLGQVLRTKEASQAADIAAVPTHGDKARQALVNLAGARTLINVPMLKDNEVIGVIGVYRQEVRPFTDKQIELVKSFAAQAVIAIENARLLGELRESLQQQTATADVLKVISRSTFDLRAVLRTLVESAARLCDADKAVITREKNGAFYRTEAYGYSREFMEYIKEVPIEIERGSASGRALLEGRAVHIPDVMADPEYTMVEAQKLGNFRTILSVPMLREGVPIGVLNVTRSEVRPFTDKQIELVTTFADQAAIAIENVRLFESVEARTRELAQSLEDLHTTQDRLVQTQKLASLGQLTAGIAHEIKNPLNFVNNFSAVSVELIDELRQALSGAHLDSKLRAEISEIADTLQGNLDKVVQHGKRADAIVKNMLLHSREGSGEHRVVDINALVEESLNLAYHGARAEKQGFNITLERSLDPAAGQADVFPQDITRVLLNLISNGFYAATKRKAQADGDGYEPTLAAGTRSLGDRVEISVRDNGTGIPPEVKEKMFNPFFTTKPAGEGTGLGLSISHDIIVKQHGGSIEVDTKPGEFTKIRIILPRAAMLSTERA